MNIVRHVLLVIDRFLPVFLALGSVYPVDSGTIFFLIKVYNRVTVSQDNANSRRTLCLSTWPMARLNRFTR